MNQLVKVALTTTPAVSAQPQICTSEFFFVSGVSLGHTWFRLLMFSPAACDGLSHI